MDASRWPKRDSQLGKETNQMKILVAGGAGYIGSVLVGELLRKNNHVKVIDALLFGGESLLAYQNNPKFELIRADIRRTKGLTLELSGMDAVVNLAALVGEDACKANPKAARQINCDAAISLAQASAGAGVARYIFISTCSNYGVSQSGKKAAEEDKTRPISLYSQTKVEAEHAILALSHKNFFPCVLRLATVFGLSPRMRFDLIVNEFMWQAYLGKSIRLYKPKAWRPLIHVVDVAEAILAAMSVSSRLMDGQVFNIGYDNYQKKHISRLLARVFPKCIIEEVAGGDERDYLVSFQKAKRALNFLASRSLEEGIKEISHALESGVFPNQDLRDYSNKHIFSL